MARNLETIWKILEHIKVFFGITKLENPRLSRIQKLLSGLICLSAVLVNLNFFFAIWKSDQLTWTICYGVFSCSMMSCSIMAVYFLAKLGSYVEGMQWCEDLHSREFGHLKDFQEAKTTSTRYFILFCVIAPTMTGSVVIIQSVVLSLWKGVVTNAVMTPGPFGTAWENVLITLLQSVLCFTVSLCAGATLGYLIMINKHQMALMRLDIAFLKQLTPSLEKTHFDEKVKEIVDLHCEVIGSQQEFSALVSYQMMIAEFMTFALSIVTWIILFFIWNLMFVGLACIYTTYIFVVPCFMTEMVSTTFQDFQDAIYEVKWYEMGPKQRKVLLQLMVMAERQNLLRCGPFYVINYEALTNLMNRVYNYGLIINAFLDPTLI